MFFEKYQTDMGRDACRPFTRLLPSRYFPVRSMLEKYLNCMSHSPVPRTPNSCFSHSPPEHNNQPFRRYHGTPI